MHPLATSILIQFAYTLPSLAPLVVALLVRNRCARPGLVVGGAVTLAATAVLSFIMNAAITVAVFQDPMASRWTTPFAIMLMAAGTAGTVLLVLGAVIKQPTTVPPPTPTIAG
ncbi:MAG: hypothetical protein K4304_04235 [Propionicimonas sp.]